MNDRAATELLLERFSEAGIAAEPWSLAGGHWAAAVPDLDGDLMTPNLLAIWDDTDPDRSGEGGAAVVLQDENRDDWDNWTYVLWEDRRLVAPDLLVMVTSDAADMLDDGYDLETIRDELGREYR